VKIKASKSESKGMVERREERREREKRELEKRERRKRRNEEKKERIHTIHQKYFGLNYITYWYYYLILSIHAASKHLDCVVYTTVTIGSCLCSLLYFLLLFFSL
jgi:hypothetical protein